MNDIHIVFDEKKFRDLIQGKVVTFEGFSTLDPATAGDLTVKAVLSDPQMMPAIILEAWTGVKRS